MNRDAREISSRVASLVSRYKKPRLFLSAALQESVAVSRCWVIWQAVEPKPITTAGEATRWVALVPPSRVRTFRRAADDTMEPPDNRYTSTQSSRLYKLIIYIIIRLSVKLGLLKSVTSHSTKERLGILCIDFIHPTR